jgi:hypothetical protein
MAGIPPALDSDTEDVSWALQTAEALWRRNERSDALVWLRRAAQAAGEAEHDDRALALAHDAAELAEWIAGRALPSPASIRDRSDYFEESRTTQTDEVEDLSSSIEIVVESAPSLPRDREDTPTLSDEESPGLIPPDRPTAPMRGPPSPPPPRIPSAAEKHAGILDPWAEGAEPNRPAEKNRAGIAVLAAMPARGHTPPGAYETAKPSPAARMFDSDEVVTSAPPIARVRPPVRSRQPAHAPAIAVNLSGVDAFADLPDDARIAFARAAVVRDLTPDREISGFALALVLEGSVYVAATVVDTPAERLDAGEVVRARGTLDHVMPMRLVSASPATRVAIWDEAAIDQAFRNAPWVEDDLRAAGDRFQALVGVTMGALGARLDPELRAQVASRLLLRVLAEHEIFAARGKPIPGLLVVGAGELELVTDEGTPEGGVLRAGDFLFPSEVLRAAPAPSTVRASRGGALVLFAERRAAQELLVTCPPLLEIFAG